MNSMDKHEVHLVVGLQAPGGGYFELSLQMLKRKHGRFSMQIVPLNYSEFLSLSEIQR